MFDDSSNSDPVEYLLFDDNCNSELDNLPSVDEDRELYDMSVDIDEIDHNEFQRSLVVDESEIVGDNETTSDSQEDEMEVESSECWVDTCLLENFRPFQGNYKNKLYFWQEYTYLKKTGQPFGGICGLAWRSMYQLQLFKYEDTLSAV